MNYSQRLLVSTVRQRQRLYLLFNKPLKRFVVLPALHPRLKPWAAEQVISIYMEGYNFSAATNLEATSAVNVPNSPPQKVVG